MRTSQIQRTLQDLESNDLKIFNSAVVKAPRQGFYLWQDKKSICFVHQDIYHFDNYSVKVFNPTEGENGKPFDVFDLTTKHFNLDKLSENVIDKVPFNEYHITVNEKVLGVVFNFEHAKLIYENLMESFIKNSQYPSQQYLEKNFGIRSVTNGWGDLVGTTIKIKLGGQNLDEKRASVTPKNMRQLSQKSL